jgi:hypothetical protein
MLLATLRVSVCFRKEPLFEQDALDDSLVSDLDFSATVRMVRYQDPGLEPTMAYMGALLSNHGNSGLGAEA